MTLRTNFQMAMREAAVDLLEGFKAEAGIGLQIHRARPRSIYPPTAFVESLSETVAYTGLLHQRTPRVEVIVLHGLFDSAEAVDQRDAFVDAFLDYVLDDYHAAGGETLIALTNVEDIPAFVPDWIRPVRDGVLPTYYATQITLEGFAASG